MLHELILALNGYPGSIFTKKENGHIQIVPDLPFMQESEETALNILCKLSTHYSRFQTFIRDFGSYPSPASVGPHGLYLRAFCEGLDNVLNTYRELILDIEQEVLSDPNLTAHYIADVLEMYQELFPAISRILDQIQLQQAHGCILLETLYNSASNGVSKVKYSLLRILHVCQGVFYRQLASWMLHGMLMDRYHEFFIYKLKRSEATPATDVIDDELGLAGISAKQIEQLMRLTEDEDIDRQTQFALRSEMIPSYLPVRIAEKILFVGESVQMFESEKPGSDHKIKGSILKGKEEEFSRELMEQSRHSVFEVMAFEKVVDRIRVYVAKQLWQIIVEEANLVGQLRIMKDFFLLGRGELFLAFIDQAQGLLKAPPTGSTQHDVTLTFQQAARNVLMEDEHLLQHFTFIIDAKNWNNTKKDQTENAPNSGWTSLNMNCTVDWPLHILMTPSVIERYNSLFKFLLLVKRIQLELQQCWVQQMQNRCLHVTNEEKHKWWLRNHLAFLVDNLQYYLQVDVIESQFSILLEKVQNTHDFEAVRYAHEQFLTSLLSQSFLLMKPITHCINEILDVCHQFCVLVLHADTELIQSQLEDITKNFQRQSNLLFKILSNVKSHQASSHLSQLLLRIDFNNYFSLSGGQLGSIDVMEDTLGKASTSSSRH